MGEDRGAHCVNSSGGVGGFNNWVITNSYGYCSPYTIYSFGSGPWYVRSGGDVNYNVWNVSYGALRIVDRYLVINFRCACLIRVMLIIMMMVCGFPTALRSPDLSNGSGAYLVRSSGDVIGSNDYGVSYSYGNLFSLSIHRSHLLLVVNQPGWRHPQQHRLC